MNPDREASHQRAEESTGTPTPLLDWAGRTLWRSWRVIVLTSVVAAISTYALQSLNPVLYEATTTLLYSPPPFLQGSASPEVSGMIPSPLSVKDYEQLLGSNSMLSAIIQDLGLKHPKTGKVRDVSALRRSIRVTTGVAEKTVAGTSYTHVIELAVRWSSPQVAEEIAGAWASLAEQKAREVGLARNVGTIEFLTEATDNSKSDLDATQDALKEFDQQWNLDVIRGDLETARTALVQYRGQRTDAEIVIASTQTKIRHIGQMLQGEWNLDLLRAEQDRLQEVLVRYWGERTDAEIAIATAQARISELQGMLSGEEAEIRPVVELFKAPPDETYWEQKLRADGRKGAEMTPEIGLREEQVNQIYVVLKSELASTEAALAGKLKKKEVTDAAIRELEGKVQELNARYAALRLEPTRATEMTLKPDFEAAQVALATVLQQKATRERMIAVLEQQVQDLNGEYARLRLERERLSHQVAVLKDSYAALCISAQSAKISQLNQISDLRVVGKAVVSNIPVTRSPRKVFLVALIAGLVAAGALALWSDAYARSGRGWTRPG